MLATTVKANPPRYSWPEINKTIQTEAMQPGTGTEAMQTGTGIEAMQPANVLSGPIL